MIDNVSFPSLVPSVSTDFTAGDVELAPENVNLHVLYASHDPNTVVLSSPYGPLLTQPLVINHISTMSMPYCQW